jgi:RNase P subunit RPR2
MDIAEVKNRMICEGCGERKFLQQLSDTTIKCRICGTLHRFTDDGHGLGMLIKSNLTKVKFKRLTQVKD